MFVCVQGGEKGEKRTSPWIQLSKQEKGGDSLVTLGGGSGYRMQMMHLFQAG